MFIEIIMSGIILGEVTYTKDIKPIFEKHCASCHNSGWADKNWMDYDTAKKNSLKIKDRVFVVKDMPPGNLTEMTDKERETVAQWVDQGAKK